MKFWNKKVVFLGPDIAVKAAELVDAWDAMQASWGSETISAAESFRRSSIRDEKYKALRDAVHLEKEK